ncbi:TerB family tellurite resistance protein [Terrilactibacillus sp. S3-3]|nr:TerB family tellurite resistance protein [Terrilactibacillus sp. S3-3]
MQDLFFLFLALLLSCCCRLQEIKEIFSEQDGKKLARSMDQSSWSRKIDVTCPYCGSHVIIDNIPGNWVCSHCEQLFTYSTDGRIYKQRHETVSPAVELMVKLFAKVAKADGVVTSLEVEKVDEIVRSVFRPSNAQLSEIRRIFSTMRDILQILIRNSSMSCISRFKDGKTF